MDAYTGRKKQSFEELEEYIKLSGAKYLRLGFYDLLGIQRGKMLPVSNLKSLSNGHNPSCSSAVMALGYDDDFAESSLLLDKRDDMDIVPDLSTAVPLPYSPDTIYLHSDLFYNGQALIVSPRVFLKNVVDKYHELGLEPVCASELEFYAFKRDAENRLIPYVDANCNCYTVTAQNDSCGLIKGIADALSAMDSGYLGWNHEFFSGQYEFNWKHSKAVEAADRGMLFKSICRDIAFKTGTEVSFMARPAGTPGGSGCHLHISLCDMKTGKNVFYDPDKKDGLSDTAKFMSGGILLHAKALAPFLAPTVNCYKRYQLESYAPTHIAWGDDNRTVYLRVPNRRGAETRLEVRAGSAACNGYLALAVLLLAGLDGIKGRIQPPPMIDANVYKDSSVRATLDSLPTRLAEAVSIARSDPWVKSAVPPELLELFLSLKEREYLSFESYVTDWETQTYYKQT